MSRGSWSESQWGRRGCLGQGTRWKPLMELENQTSFAMAISLCCCGAGRPCDSQLPDWTNSELRSGTAMCVICRHGIDAGVRRHSRRHSRSKNETFYLQRKNSDRNQEYCWQAESAVDGRLFDSGCSSEVRAGAARLSLFNPLLLLVPISAPDRFSPFRSSLSGQLSCWPAPDRSVSVPHFPPSRPATWL